MATGGASRARLAEALETAYAQGLISEQTFQLRMDAVLRPSLVRPGQVIGDLTFRGSGLRTRLTSAMATISSRLVDVFGERPARPSTLLALDWSGPNRELLVGRHHACQVRLDDVSVSRRHARLILRDGRWIVQDLGSTNGTVVNGLRVGRCEVRPGDRIQLGAEQLQVD